jgi:sugar phosphate isomerase/epimerase
MEDIKLLKIINNNYNMNIKTVKETKIGVEVQSFPQHILDEDYSEILKECKTNLKNLNNIISLHGSSFDLNPGSTDKKVLELTRYRYMQSIDIAKGIGAKYVIFHSQINPLISVDRIRKLKLDNQVGFWKNFLKEINNLDITILLENEYENNYEELLYIVKEVNSPKLRICLDTGHALAYSNIDLEKWIIELKGYIEYVHLHFNDGSFDSHNAPNKEQLISFKNMIKRANINPFICLEYTVSSIDDEIRRIRNILNE